MDSMPEDVVVLLFSGHGLLDKVSNYYFSTYDINPENPKGKGLAYDEIQTLLDKVPARRRLVLMDSCHSGESDKDCVWSGQDIQSNNDANKGDLLDAEMPQSLDKVIGEPEPDSPVTVKSG